MVKVARLYHEHGVRQPEIARRLHVSQARVSRLLKQAELDGHRPDHRRRPRGRADGARGAARGALRAARGDRRRGARRHRGRASRATSASPPRAILEASLTGGDVVGISSLELDAARRRGCDAPAAAQGRRASARCSSSAASAIPRAEAHAARLTQRFADLTGARPTFLLAPGIAASVDARDALATDRFVQEALDGLAEVTLALVGIGALEPSQPAPEQRQHLLRAASCEALGERGAVGDICLRFFDAQGARVESDVDRRVIGVTLEQLRAGRPLRRHRRRRAQVRGDPRRAARRLDQRADHRPRHGRAAARRPLT